MEKPFVLMPIIASVVIQQDNKYLMIQEKTPKILGLWNLPGGKVDQGETIEQAAVREAREETGYEVELVNKIGIFQRNSNEPPKHVFEAKIIGGKLSFPEDEILSAEWFTATEIRGKRGSIRENLAIDVLDVLKK
jgi:8-oxo-dGTP diphosphatase